MTEDLPRVLCVDDEPKLLAALERNLYDEFDITTAGSGAEALAAIQSEEPFAVILSDMRMPNMDGATFLSKARALAPDSVRILLTGQADAESAMKAINEGAIFRFMTKPCSKQVLSEALNAGVDQHRLLKTERDLLETTLTGAVNTLSEVLSMVAPLAFQRANFAQSCVRHALANLKWTNGWMYEVAAALSQIGCVSIPAEVIENDVAQRPLSPKEQALLDGHPDVAYRLVTAIPRMELVAQIIRHQAHAPPADAPQEVVQGADLLRAALELQRRMSRSPGAKPQDILQAQKPPIPAYLSQALADFRVDLSEHRSVKVRDLMPGWVTEEDIRCQNGVMVLAAGTELSETAISTMQRLAANQAIKEPIRVRCKN